MAGRRRGRYTPEYKERIVELVRAGRSPGSLAREFEPSEQTIRNWVKQADLDEGSGQLTTEARKEMRELKRDVKRLRMERDILKNSHGHPGAPRGTETMLRAGAEVVRLTGARSPLKNVTNEGREGRHHGQKNRIRTSAAARGRWTW